MTIEKLTDAQRNTLLDLTLPHGEGERALRIIDQLTAECERLRASSSEAYRLLSSNESLKAARAMQALRHGIDVECPGCGYVGKLWEHKCPARAALAEARAARALLRRSIPIMSDEVLREVGAHLAVQEPLRQSTTADPIQMCSCCRDEHRPAPKPSSGCWMRWYRGTSSRFASTRERPEHEGYGTRWSPLEVKLAPLCQAELARRGLKP